MGRARGGGGKPHSLFPGLLYRDITYRLFSFSYKFSVYYFPISDGLITSSATFSLRFLATSLTQVWQEVPFLQVGDELPVFENKT